MQEGLAGVLAGTTLLKTMDDFVQHFAEDPDIVAEYVLRRLDPVTLARYDAHVRTCVGCRQAVDAEKMIAAGVKRHGRDHIKERLGTLVGMPPPRRIPWPHMLSVAAVLLILVGVGIYQGWFVTRVEKKDVAALEQPELGGKLENAIPEMHNEQAQPPQAASRSSEPSLKPRDAEHKHRPDESKVKGEPEKFGIAQAPADRLEEALGAASKDKRRADIPQPAMVSVGGQQEFWASGTLITQAMAKKEADEGRQARYLSPNGIHAADAARAKVNTFGQVTLEQRPASRLPASIQSQQLYDRQTIQTLVRQSEGETHLTLYPESPFDSTQLHFARAQQVAPDSLVVQIGNQQIGYRLPLPALVPRQIDSIKPGRR